jgi:hypothetical protein
MALSLKNEGPEPGHEHDKRGGRTHRGHRARGGRTAVHEYNAEGSPEMAAAKDEKPAFKRGGRKERDEKEEREHRRSGGVAHGAAARERLDRPKRAAGGASPYSSAKSGTGPTDSQEGRGHEGVRPKGHGG